MIKISKCERISHCRRNPAKFEQCVTSLSFIFLTAIKTGEITDLPMQPCRGVEIVRLVKENPKFFF